MTAFEPQLAIHKFGNVHIEYRYIPPVPDVLGSWFIVAAKDGEEKRFTMKDVLETHKFATIQDLNQWISEQFNDN